MRCRSRPGRSRAPIAWRSTTSSCASRKTSGTPWLTRDGRLSAADEPLHPMKILAGILSALILLIQYPLWLGKGGWLRAWHMENDLSGQKVKNGQLEVRNAGLAAEVRDLKQGTEAIEERARYELGMVRQDEVFFQVEEAKRHETVPGAAPAVRP